MPNIRLLETEKEAIRHYLATPLAYVSIKYASLFENNLPDGIKITRPQEKPYYRSYLIPFGNEGLFHCVPMIKHHTNDPLLHSATTLHGDTYFHQNKIDFPLCPPSDEVLALYVDEESDDEALDEADLESIQALKQYWRIAKSTPDYVQMVHQPGRFKKNIKKAINDRGQQFFLKSTFFYHKTPADFKDSLPVSINASSVGPSIFRHKREEGFFSTKRIDIFHDAGLDLVDFIQQNRGLLTPIKRTLLAFEILNQYIQQVFNKGIIHSDIKSANICVTETSQPNLPFKVTFIDFDDAFYQNEIKRSGSVTPGYTAPEFFHCEQDYTHQLANRAKGADRFEQTLKSNYTEYFSQAADIHSLGLCLLNDLKLPNQAGIYHLSQQMISIDSQNRPTGNDIKTVLNGIHIPNAPENVSQQSFMK